MTALTHCARSAQIETVYRRRLPHGRGAVLHDDPRFPGHVSVSVGTAIRLWLTNADATDLLRLCLAVINQATPDTAAAGGGFCLDSGPALTIGPRCNGFGQPIPGAYRLSVGSAIRNRIDHADLYALVAVLAAYTHRKDTR